MFEIPVLSKGTAADVADKRLVEVSEDGTQEFVLFDHNGDPIGLQHVADHTALVERNKQLKNNGTGGWSKTKEWRHVASIDPGMLIDWASKKGVTYDFICSKEGFEEIVLKYLADPDYRALRVDK